MRIFFVYLDWTLDNRVFNVGKGLASRVNDVKRRSKRWKAIAAKHGHRREVVFATKDQQAAWDLETQLIQQYQTYCYGNKDSWGANFTLGGDGARGCPTSVLQKQMLRERNSSKFGREYTLKGVEAAANLKRDKPGHMRGRKNPGATAWCASDAGKASIRKAIEASANARRGKPAHNHGISHTEETKRKISEARSGQQMKPLSAAHKQKLREKALLREAKKRELKACADTSQNEHHASLPSTSHDQDVPIHHL